MKPLRSRATRPLRKLHRWAGIGGAAFLVLLATTGILLNHSSALGLDRQFVANGWLLDRYGVASPEAGPSFYVQGSRVTQIGESLYLDASEVEGLKLPMLVGAVEVEGSVAVATDGELVIMSSVGEVLERWPLEPEIGGGIEAIAPTASGIALRTERGVNLFDLQSATILTLGSEAGAFDWAEPTAPGPALAAAIGTHYRSQILSLERLLLDAHSGRLVGLSGVVITDLAAAAILFLAVSGFIIWLRR